MHRIFDVTTHYSAPSHKIHTHTHMQVDGALLCSLFCFFLLSLLVRSCLHIHLTANKTEIRITLLLRRCESMFVHCESLENIYPNKIFTLHCSVWWSQPYAVSFCNFPVYRFLIHIFWMKIVWVCTHAHWMERREEEKKKGKRSHAFRQQLHTFYINQMICKLFIV